MTIYVLSTAARSPHSKGYHHLTDVIGKCVDHRACHRHGCQSPPKT
ncbi:hypothetical protein [Calothrix sp. NIES-2100]